MLNHFRTLILVGIMSLSCTDDNPGHSSEAKFNASEHLILGDQGFQQACRKSQHCPKSISREDGKMNFTYGELISFGGDFYSTVDEMYFEEKRPFWRFFRNDIADTKKLFRKGAAYVEAQKHGHEEGDYPDFNKQYAWNFPKYTRILEDNLDHFGFHNVLRYADAHGQALEIAYKASKLRSSHPEKAKKLMEKAFFYNGFADHFLTDSFASGHMRVPRLQINHWAANRGLRSRDAGILTKIIHDRDGEVIKSGAHGLPVRNSVGDTWFARCDAQLFFNYTEGVKGVEIAVESVASSIQEILDAYDGKLPSSTYAALDFVPFVDESYSSLYKIFHEDMTPENRKSILANARWYFKIPGVSKVNNEVLEEFFSDLESLMLEFRLAIAKEIEGENELIKFIPVEYLEAYRKVK